MARSTATFISYDLRPAKQSERRILIDLLKIGGDCGLPIATYRYVDMGANRFYDFLLMHKYLGITKMVSLEHDAQMFKRAMFNVPYKFISVLKKSSASFISEDACAEPTAYWLDYDGGIGSNMVRDITGLSTKMNVGDFFFVTVSGNPPRAIFDGSASDRLVWLQDNLGDVAGSVNQTDTERSQFTKAVHKILLASFQNAFAPRRDGLFVPILQVEYSDSVPMVTVGGAFLQAEQAAVYMGKVCLSLPFLVGTSAMLYEIKSLHLTERERVLFDLAVTSRRKRLSERNALNKLGFKDAEIDAYRDLVRYYPRYVETLV